MTNIRLMLCAVAVCAACASGGSAGSRPAGTRNLITSQQLRAISVQTAYDAVRRLRPTWLRSRARGATAVVFLDDSRIGGLEQLETMSVETVLEMRYISAADATTRWGSGYQGGVIQIILRR